jgi:hypothetical protein
MDIFSRQPAPTSSSSDVPKTQLTQKWLTFLFVGVKKEVIPVTIGILAQIAAHLSGPECTACGPHLDIHACEFRTCMSIPTLAVNVDSFYYMNMSRAKEERA